MSVSVSVPFLCCTDISKNDFFIAGVRECGKRERRGGW